MDQEEMKTSGCAGCGINDFMPAIGYWYGEFSGVAAGFAVKMIEG